jgi:EAL domain-containing protein (putative c-di-GMP-specific phosphodiesterase class I)
VAAPFPGLAEVFVSVSAWACNMRQGYLYSRPVPLGEITAA